MAEHRMNAPAGWRDMDDDAFMNAIWIGVETMSDAELHAASVGVRGLRAVMELDAELAIGGLPGFVGNSAGRLGTSAVEFMHLVDETSAAQLRSIFDRCGFDPSVEDNQARLETVLASVGVDWLADLSAEAMNCIADFIEKLPRYIRTHPDEFFV